MIRKHSPFRYLAVLMALLALAAGASAAFAFPGRISPMLPSADFLKDKTDPLEFWEAFPSPDDGAEVSSGSQVRDALALLAASHHAFSRSA